MKEKENIFEAFNCTLVLYPTQKRGNYLQLILKELVHPGHLRGNAKIDCSIADLDDETAADIRVDLKVVSDADKNSKDGDNLTLDTTFNFCPCPMYDDFEIVVSNCLRTLLSSGYKQMMLEYTSTKLLGRHILQHL
jgi:hypothetical protein